MARLLRMLRKKALRLAPEPERGSCHLPEEKSGPSVPAGGEAAVGQARRWQFSAFWSRKPAPGAGAEAGESRPKWSWPRRRLGRQDPAQEGSRAGWLWGCLCRKHRPHEPSPEAHQEASPCPVPEDLPASPGQELEDLGSSMSSSSRSLWENSSSSQSGSSEADGCRCPLPGTPRDQEDEEAAKGLAAEEAALKAISEQLQGGQKDEAQQLRFLHAIHPACVAALQAGQDTLEPHCCKPAVVQRIVEFLEELPQESAPSAVLSNSLIAVSHLSAMNPALEPEVETHLLRAALHGVFTMGTGKDAPHIQAQKKVTEDLLHVMLGNLLAESPDTARLHYIMEHIGFWMGSRVPEERARAIRSSAALLRLTISLPEFDNSAPFPRMGHHVAQLALCISDPAEDTSRRAREAIYRLYLILLHQRGLTVHQAEDLWCWDWHQDRRLLEYKNIARVGEVFGQFFSEGQRGYYVRTAVLAIHDPLLRVSQAGLVLAYSILGEADRLMGSESEDVTKKVMRELHIIRRLRQLPEALQGLCLREQH